MTLDPSTTMEGFHRLLAWQKAYELTLSIYKVTRGFPNMEQYGMTSQLQRAAVSVSANIAEGYERNYRKEYLQFLNIARGSLGEVETYLLLARDLEYVAEKEYEKLESMRAETGRLLRGLINSLTGKRKGQGARVRTQGEFGE